MEIVRGKALKMLVRDHERITKVIPKSKYLRELSPGVHEVLVHFGLDEVQILKNMRLKGVRSPIAVQYDWPGKYRPFDHQRTTAEFLTLHKRCFCFSEQGTGKTSSIIWAADYLMKTNRVKRMLVVCPVSIMQSAWVADIFKTAMHRKVGVAHGTREQRRKVINGAYDIVVINYDGVSIVEEDIKGKFDLIVLDEANYIKTATTKRWKTINRLVLPDTWLWLMTGTPAAQSPLDAYGLSRLVCPNRVPKFFGQWRDKVMHKINMYKWVPSPRATEQVNAALQPAIRFTKKECLDLPDETYQTRNIPLTPQQDKYYKDFKTKMMVHADGERITAVHAAAMLSKLLQLSCLSSSTEVLTPYGWKCILQVTTDDKLWDGVEWVEHQGVVPMGVKQTLNVDGVYATADHRFLTELGWRTAEEILYGAESVGFNWADVRIPDGVISCGDDGAQLRDVGVPMRVWESGDTQKPESTEQKPPTRKPLRVHGVQDKRDAWDVQKSSVSNMERYEAALLRWARQRLQKLRGARDQCMRTVGGLIRSVLGGHAGWIRRVVNIRPYRCERGLHPGELPVGHSEGAIKQHAFQPRTGDPEGRYDANASGGGVWVEEGNAIRPTDAIRVGRGTCVVDSRTEPTYDIVNCGPRNRFTARSIRGGVIVHNCGAVYSDTGDVVQFDGSNRTTVLLEVVAEASHKVIVFVPFRHAITLVTKTLEKEGYTVGVIDGSVPLAKRTELFRAFQETPNPHVLVIQPQAAAHGVTLTAADTVVWFGPVASVETYLQGNARVHRAGQTNKVTVVRLCGSAAEAKVYKSLEVKGGAQGTLMALYEEVVKGE